MPTDQFTLRSDQIPPATRVVAFTGSEAISRAYHFEIFVIVQQADGELDPDALLGKAATLEINDETGTPRRWYHGVVASVELQHDLGVDLLYRLELVPRLWALSLSHHSRVYANETFHKVAERVLKTANLKKDEDFSIGFAPGRPYEHLTEYRESHFDFLSRVMEREGYYYYFEQRDDREFMVITNSKDQQPDSSPPATPFFAVGSDDTSGVEAIRSFRMRAVAMPTNVRLREYDPQQPDANLTGTSDVPHSVLGQLDYFGENYTSQGDGNRLAGYRKEELQSRLKRFYGTGRVFNLAAGHYFDLEAHGRLDGRYMVVELRHVGSNFSGAETARERLGFDSETNYRVDVVAIPGDQQFRPARVSPVPRIYGVEEAVICGAASSPYAQIDSHGRYRVKVYFDEGDAKDGKASTWVRMIQPHGGNPEGHHFPLRKGTEVLLVFLGGDPDRPVIAGAAHNTNKPAVVTESNHTLNVIHTGSNNRIEMDDADGAQYINVSTPPMNTLLHLGAHAGPGGSHNFVLTTDGDGLIHTGTNLDVFVDEHKHEIVKNTVVEEYQNTLDTTVTLATTIHYKDTLMLDVDKQSEERFHDTRFVETTLDYLENRLANSDLVITGTHTHENTGEVTEKFKGGQKITVTGNREDTVTVEVKETYGKHELTVLAEHKTTILGAEVSLKVQNSSETTVGFKNENTIGGKIESILGIKSETVVGLTNENKCAVSIDIDLAPTISSKSVELERVGFKLKKKEAEMGNVSVTIVQQSLTITQVNMMIVA
jgi:type VI secretion system secreted protein VgrG